VRVGIRQQRQEARPLDRRIELALVMRLGAGQTRRRDLAVLADEVSQRVDVLVVDLLDLLGGEAAELLALEKRVLLRRAPCSLALALAALALASHHCHRVLLNSV